MRAFALALAGAVLIGIGCTEGRLPTEPSGPRPTTIRLSLNATVSAAGRAIKVVGFYARAATPNTLIPFDSAVVTLDGTESALPIRLDVASCLADPLRELPPGLTSSETAQLCVLHLVLSLYDAQNRQIDQVTLAPVSVRPGTDAAAPPVQLGSVVQTVTLAPRTQTFNAIGFTGTITSVVVDNFGQTIVSPAMVYRSLSPTVATVDSATGRITTRGIGSARIVGASRDKVDTVAVVVRQILNSVLVTGPVSPLQLGDSGQVTGVPRDSADTPMQPADAAVTFTTSDANVVAVNATTGRIRATGLGTATVRGAVGAIGSSVSVTVIPVPVASVVVIPATSNLLIGQSFQMTAATRDLAGNDLSGRVVTWASGDATIATISTTGLATARSLGQVTITATSEGRSGIGTMTVSAVPVASVSITPAAPRLFVSQSITLSAVARDGANNPLAGRPTLWTSSDPSIATVTPAGVVTALRVGSVTISAESEGKVGTVPLVVPAAQLRVSQQPSGALAGVVLSAQPVVAIVDASNAPITSFSGAVTVSLATVTGTLSGTTTVNAVRGVATFTDLRVNEDGTHAFQFTSDAASSVTSSPFTLAALPATQLVITAQPSDALTGAVLTPPASVEIRNANGGLVATSTVAVNATLNGSGGVLSGTTTVNAVGGVATFSNLAITGPGTFTVTFSAGTLSSATSRSIAIGALPPSQLGVVTQPGGAVTGSALAPQPVVAIQNASGIVVPSATNVVTATLVGTGGTLSGTTTVAAVNGVATFTNLVVTGAGSYTIAFSASTLTSVTSQAVVITTAPATQLGLSTAPAGAVAGAPFGTQPVVEVRNAAGGVVSTSSAAVTVALAAGDPGTLSGTTTVTAVNGRATFTNLQLSAAGSYTLTFTAAGLTAVSTPLAVAITPPTQLALTTQPGGAVTGSALAPQPVVAIQNASGIVVSSATNAVTASLVGTGATLTGTTTVAAVNGVATFTDLVVTGVGNYSLNFTSGALSTARSGLFTISPLPAGQLASIVVTPDPATLASRATQQFVAVGKDAAGNVVPFTPTWSVVNGGGSIDAAGVFTAGTLAGTYTNTVRAASGGTSSSATVIVTPGPVATITVTPNPVTLGAGSTQQFTAVGTDASGNVVAISPVWSVVNGGGSISAGSGLFTASNLAGTYANTVRATSGATTGSATVTIVANSLVITTQPGGAVTGSPLSPQPVVEVRDASNSVVTGSSVAVTATLNGSGGTLSGTSSVTAVNGVATFTNLVVSGPGSYALVFSASSLTSATSSGFTIAPPPASQLGVSRQPSGAANGVAFITQPVVTIRDASGATSSSATAAVTVAIASGTGTLSGTTTVNAVNGVATFTNLTISGTGTYTLVFTSSGLTSATSDPFVVAPGGIVLAVGTSAFSTTVAGQNLVLPVLVDMTNASGGNVASITFSLTFDPNRFSFVSASSAGSPLTITDNTSQANTTGTINVSGFAASGFTTTSTIYSITLMAKTTTSSVTSNVLAAVSAAGQENGSAVTVAPRNHAATVTP